MFRLFGFDVHVRAGFIVFLALLIMLYQNALGVWLALGLAVFTLIHELGHAAVARSAGADASISLDFLAGYTSFRPNPLRPLTRGRRAAISAAGPFAQIATSVAVLAAMGVNPLSLDSVRRSSDAAAAFWWAGPAIGVLNLIPVLPLDGGHLLLTAVEPALGKKAMRSVAIFSLALTGAGVVAMAVTGRTNFVIFVAFLLFNQFQILQATGRPTVANRPASRFAGAEQQAWESGQAGLLEPGQRVSPWFEAHQALSRGDAGGAMGVVLADLRSTNDPRWSPPVAASPAQLRAIVSVLPADLPRPGNPYSARVLTEILLSIGDVDRAGHYAAVAFGEHRESALATTVARAAAATGDAENAVRWIEAAAQAPDEESVGHSRLLAVTIDQAPEFASLRGDPTIRRIRASIT